MKNNCNRSFSLAAGVIIMLCYGLLYAWSIYSSPLSAEFGWTNARLGLCFTIIMIAFCLGGILGSILTKKLGCRRSILIGGIMSLVGYGLASLLSASSVWLLYTAFSVSGLACGIVYNATVSTVVMRFPDKKGLASGILLMGFGASTLVFGSLASWLMNAPKVGWRRVYLITGVLLFVIAFFGRRFIVYEKPENAQAEAGFAEESLNPKQMMSTSSFWLFFLTASVLSFFGQGVIGHAKNIALEGSVPQNLAALTIDDLALLVHYIVILQHVPADFVVAAFNALL